MALPVWAPTTFYAPGSTVQPLTVPPVTQTPIANAGFEDGNVEWTTEAGWSIVTQQGSEPPFQGSRYAMFSGSGVAEGRIISQTIVPVRVGQKIKASCQVRRKRTSYTGGRVEIDWLDENEILIFSSQGNTIETTGSTTGNWRKSEVEAFAPAGAAFARLAGFAYRSQGSHDLFLDSFTWDYSYTPEGAGLVFTAVQPSAGFSGATEPVWPTVNGQQVVDNEVVWEAIEGTRVVWEANPIIVSGYIEPDWPLQVGSEVADNTGIWTAVSRRVVDEKCPNSPIVAIATSKVFSGDDDIVGFSATVNPLDWTTEEDAGYLPFGLQTFGANPVTAMGLYRGNLVVFNSVGYQVWQVGEDPAEHALLDAAPIGCIWHKSVLPVVNDLVFLSNLGVRNIGVAGASTNLQAGDLGQPVDPLVIAAIAALEEGEEPLGLYVPAYGQYWLFFGSEAFVLTINGAKRRSWSRYTFPEAITDWTIDGEDLVLRTETHKVWRVSADYTDDDHFCSPPEVDLPYMPTLGPGTLEIDANAVLDRRSSSGGTFSPDSYLGNPAVFDPPAYALVLQMMTPGAGDLECVIHGLDENGATVQETITFDGSSTHRYIVGSQLFSQIDSIVQTGNTADQFFSVGYQRFIEDAEAEELTVTIHGYWTVNNSSDPASNNGLFVPEVDTAQILPAESVLLARRNANTTTTERTYTETDGVTPSASVTLPAGSTIGEVVIGTETLNSIFFIDRTGSGGVTPFVDLGIQFAVAAGCTGEDIVGVVQWPHLDLNSFGIEKQFASFDLVCDAPEGVNVSIGYDQSDLTRRTANYLMDADSLPGRQVPFPVTAPSFDLRLTFEPGQRWTWYAACMYVRDWRVGA